MGKSSKSSRHRACQLTLELLEDRQLLSGGSLSPAVGPSQQQTATAPVAAQTGTQTWGQQPASGTAATPNQTTQSYPSGQPDTTPDDNNSSPGSAVVGPIQASGPAATSNQPADNYAPNSASKTYQTSYGEKSYQDPHAGATDAYEYQQAEAAKPAPPVVDVASARGQPTSPPILPAAPVLILVRPAEAPAAVETGPRVARLVPAVPQSRDLDADHRWISWPTELQTALANVSDRLIEELGVDSSAGTYGFAPQLGNLLGGAFPIDLPNLQEGVDKFFARLENLAEDLAASPGTQKLIHWFLAGTMVTGALELARKRIKSTEFPERGDPNWAPFPVLAVLPPED